MRDKTRLTPVERAMKCAAMALDKKALNVKVLEIGKLSSIADYLVHAFLRFRIDDPAGNAGGMEFLICPCTYIPETRDHGKSV